MGVRPSGSDTDSAFRYVSDASPGQSDQVNRRDGEDRVRRAACGPDRGQALQIAVDQDDGCTGMTNWRDTADDETGLLAHKIRVRTLDLLPQQGAHFLLVHAVRSRR